ncbi:MAG TPA: hypothetical protein VNF47_13505 [Streptosporangiaceae bacterium]|nr:hypothetical protein [Streptosporangiaceae bacterium]
MSLLTIPRVHDLRGGPAWIDTGLRYGLTAVCAGSAGVHAALIREHLIESVPLGFAFAAAAVALAFAALVVRRPRHDSWALAAAAVTLCVIAVSYLLSRSTGIPLLIVQPEHADPVGAVTTVAELAGAGCCAALMSRKDKK